MRFYLISLIVLCSCTSEKVTILKEKDVYGKNITKANLEEFNLPERATVTTIQDKQVYAELKTIKDFLISGENKDIIPTGIYSYAFIINKDTIYSNPQLNYWLYKDKTIRYQSKIINQSILE